MPKHSKLFMQVEEQRKAPSDARIAAQEKQRNAGNAPEHTRLTPEQDSEVGHLMPGPLYRRQLLYKLSRQI